MESGNVNAERMVKKKEAGDELATREGIDGPRWDWVRPTRDRGQAELGRDILIY